MTRQPASRPQRAHRERDDDTQQQGWFIGVCGHPVPVSSEGYLGECACDKSSVNTGLRRPGKQVSG